MERPRRRVTRPRRRSRGSGDEARASGGPAASGGAAREAGLDADDAALEAARASVQRLVDEGVARGAAARRVSAETGVSRRALYVVNREDGPRGENDPALAAWGPSRRYRVGFDRDPDRVVSCGVDRWSRPGSRAESRTGATACTERPHGGRAMLRSGRRRGRGDRAAVARGRGRQAATASSRSSSSSSSSSTPGTTEKPESSATGSDASAGNPGRDGLRLECLGRGLRRVVLAPATGEHLHAGRDDLGLPVALSRVVIPGPGLEPALDGNLLALAQVASAGLGQAVPGHDRVKLGALLAAHELVGCNGELDHRLAAGGGAELGVAREATGEKDPVHRSGVSFRRAARTSVPGAPFLRPVLAAAGNDVRRAGGMPAPAGGLRREMVRRGRRSRRARRTLAVPASRPLTGHSSRPCAAPAARLRPGTPRPGPPRLVCSAGPRDRRQPVPRWRRRPLLEEGAASAP